MILVILVIEIEVDVYGGLRTRHLHVFRADHGGNGIRVCEEGFPVPIKERIHAADILSFEAGLEVASKPLNSAEHFRLRSGGILFLRRRFWGSFCRLGRVVRRGFGRVGLVEEAVLFVEHLLRGETFLLGLAGVVSGGFVGRIGPVLSRIFER